MKKGTLLRYKDGRYATFERETWFASTHGTIKAYVALWVDKKKGNHERIMAEAEEWEVADNGQQDMEGDGEGHSSILRR